MAIASTLRATSGAEVGRNPALKSLLRNIEMEQRQHQRHFPEWNLALVLSALTKPPFESLDQASDQLLTWKTGRNPCFWTCPTTTDHKLDTGDSTSRPVIYIKDASIGQGPEMHAFMHYSSTWPHLSNGMAEDRLLCPIRALRFYLERSKPWREHKHLLKPGHKRDIVPSTISGWTQKRFWSATQIPLHLSLSPTRLRRNRYDPWLHRSHSTDRPPWDRFCKLVPGAVITPSPTFISRTYLSTLPISSN